MLVKYREPWHITQNRVYGFTDVKTADTMQYDYTFYIDYELKKDPTTDKNEYSKSIFVRPGMHYGLIMKPDLFTICWEFWTEVDGENKYYDISFESDEETFYDNYFVFSLNITHFAGNGENSRHFMNWHKFDVTLCKKSVLILDKLPSLCYARKGCINQADYKTIIDIKPEGLRAYSLHFSDPN